mmetsp:Transcript_18428/g.45228  ORF Transcript_18428/g.45228 Transcript_18428/m.45228 type:complete len:490 (+) Transcript_18428:250-1719(+)
MEAAPSPSPPRPEDEASPPRPPPPRLPAGGAREAGSAEARVTVGVLMKSSKTDKFLRRLRGLGDRDETDASARGKGGLCLVRKGVRVDDGRGDAMKMAAGRSARPRFRYIAMDPQEDLSLQGKIDVLLSKPNDWVMRCLFESNPEATALVERIEKYITANPSLCVIQAPKKVIPFLDRGLMYSLIQRSKNPKVCTPRAVRISRKSWLARGDKKESGDSDEIQELQRLKYPVICKRLVACGSRNSHQMIVSPSFEALRASLDDDFRKTVPPERTRESLRLQEFCRKAYQCPVGEPGWIVQEFVPHDGTVHKVYLLGDMVHVASQPSFGSESANRPAAKDPSECKSQRTSQSSAIRQSILWNSHEPPPECGLDIMSSLKHSQVQRNSQDVEKVRKSLAEIVKEIASIFSSACSQSLEMDKIDMLGIDVIESFGRPSDPTNSVAGDDDDDGKTLYVVDVNFLPSYKTMEEKCFRVEFEKTVLNRIHQNAEDR